MPVVILSKCWKKALRTHVPGWVIVVVFTAIAAGIAALIYVNTPARPLLEKFRQLEFGMTEKDVEELFGFSGWNNPKGLGCLTGSNGEEGDKFVMFIDYCEGRREEVWTLFSKNQLIAKKYW